MKKNNQKGIVQLIIIILIAIITLSYVGIDLEEVFSKPLIKKNIIFTWVKTKEAWTDYVYNPVTNIFNKDDEESEEEEEQIVK